MGFYAKSFVYNEQPSELYNIEIASVDGGGTTNNKGSGQVDFIEQFIYRRPTPYFYGVYYSDKLTFPVSFFSPDEISAVDLSYIQNWLFGQLGYKRLTIVEPDMDDVYFNCIFTNPEIFRAGNVIYGVTADCICDSQFAYTYPKTLSYSFSGSPSGSSIIFYNNSHYPGYLYPSLDFTMSSSGSFSIVNQTDNDREFLFSGLSGSEVITVNNDLCIIESSLNVVRLPNFNKNFFRLVPGINRLVLTGNISEFNLTYQFFRRMGA